MAASMQVVQDIRKEIAENHEKVVLMVEGVKDDTTAIRDDTGKIKTEQMRKKIKGWRKDMREMLHAHMQREGDMSIQQMIEFTQQNKPDDWDGGEQDIQ